MTLQVGEVGEVGEGNTVATVEAIKREASITARCSGTVTRLAIATARVQPEHDPDDPRFVLQGHVAIVTSDIPADGEGTIVFGEAEGRRSLGARAIDGQAISAGLEVCIERVENGIAFVEPWAVVEARL